MIVTNDTAALIIVVVMCVNGYATTLLARMLFDGNLSKVGQIMLGVNIAAFVFGALDFFKLFGAYTQ